MQKGSFFKGLGMSQGWGVGIIDPSEALKKCSILFKIKSKIPDFEPDAEIGQKGAFFESLATN